MVDPRIGDTSLHSWHCLHGTPQRRTLGPDPQEPLFAIALLVVQQVRHLIMIYTDRGNSWSWRAQEQTPWGKYMCDPVCNQAGLPCLIEMRIFVLVWHRRRTGGCDDSSLKRMSRLCTKNAIDHKEGKLQVGPIDTQEV